MSDEEKEETKVTLTPITVRYVDIEPTEKIRAKIALLALILLVGF